MTVEKTADVLFAHIQELFLFEEADGNAANIYRLGDGGKLYTVRLRDLVKRGDISANVEMKPGDILIIPQSWF